MIESLSEALKHPESVTQISVPGVRYAFEFEVTQPILAPEYAGSMIRGAFGRALRKTACMTKEANCKACPLYRTCPYTAIFETPPPLEGAIQKFSQIPNPYVIEPPEWGRHSYEVGERFRFELILWGRARDQIALVIYALQRAFSHDVGHGKASLLSVSVRDERGHSTTIYGPGMGRVAPHVQETVLSVPGSTACIRLETPMRLQNNGKPLDARLITNRAFLMTLVRRVSLLAEYQCATPLAIDFNQLTVESERVALQKSLQWRDWTRYSSRQQRQMSLGGVVGEIVFENLSPALRLFLAAGVMTHVGKNASFGLGRYHIANPKLD